MPEGVITLTTGTPGSGKSYRRCAKFLAEEWLPNETGAHWSNFPLGVVPQSHFRPPAYDGETFRDRIAHYVSDKTGQSKDVIHDRICYIPPEVTATWMSGDSGPWDFFQSNDVDVNGTHIAIDEAHHYLGKFKPKKQRDKWMAWLSEARHQGATVELITQGVSTIPPEFIDAYLDYRVDLINADNELIPRINIEMRYLLELVAKITGKYHSFTYEVLYKKNPDSGGKLTSSGRTTFKFESKYFEFYDSYSLPAVGGSKGNTRKRQYEQRSWPSFIWWLFSNNAWQITTAAFFVALFVFLLPGGGIVKTTRFITSAVRSTVQSTAIVETSSDADVHDVSYDPSLPDEQPSSDEETDMEQVMHDYRRDNPTSAITPDVYERLVLQQRKLPELLGFMGSTIALDNGYILTIGDPIYDDAKGLTIDSLDHQSGVLHLSDGRTLRIKRLRKYGTATSSVNPELQQAVRPSSAVQRRRDERRSASTGGQH